MEPLSGNNSDKKSFGQAVQNPTTRWVFQFFSRIQVLIINQLYKLVLNLNVYQLELLRLLVNRYEQLVLLLDTHPNKCITKKVTNY